MLKAMRSCVGWLDWKFVAGGLAVLTALALCAKLPTLSILAGFAPIVLLAACLIPCLLPLAWLRNAARGKAKRAQALESDHEA